MDEKSKKTLQDCRGGVAQVPASESEKKPLRPSQCRGHMRRELARNFENIVDGLVARAKAGSMPHIKLATELLDVRPEEKEKVKRKGLGPLTRVLREIERRDAEKKRAALGSN